MKNIGKNKEKNYSIALNGVLASLYVVLTLVNPISYGVFQFRISEALTILPIYKKETRLGIILGVIVANSFSPLGLIDVFFGTSTAFIFYYLIDKLNINRYIKYILYCIEVGAIIGLELQIVYKVDFCITFFTTFFPQIILCLLGDFLIKRFERRINNG